MYQNHVLLQAGEGEGRRLKTFTKIDDPGGGVANYHIPSLVLGSFLFLVGSLAITFTTPKHRRYSPIVCFPVSKPQSPDSWTWYAWIIFVIRLNTRPQQALIHNMICFSQLQCPMTLLYIHSKLPTCRICTTKPEELLSFVHVCRTIP